jgi:hypothetical protein
VEATEVFVVIVAPEGDGHLEKMEPFINLRK